MTPSQNSALPPKVCHEALLNSFGENQLFPDLFSLSPLPQLIPTFSTVVGSGLQLVLPNFTLAMSRSSGFGSHLPTQSPCSDSLSLRLPKRLSSPVNVSR